MKRRAWAALLAGMCIAVSAFAAMIGGGAAAGRGVPGKSDLTGVHGPK
jgi:hypothetical protein